MTTILAHPPIDARPSSFRARMALGILLVAAADHLLFDVSIGISLGIFLVCLAGASVAANPSRRSGPLVPTVLLLAALAPLIENVSVLSAAVAFGLLAAFVLARRGELAPVPERLAAFFATAPLRFAADCESARRAGRRRPNAGRTGVVHLLGWVVPIGLAVVFLTLFGMANPIIAQWLELIDPMAWLARIGFWQMLVWVLVFLAVWPFLRPRLPRLSAKSRRAAAPASPAAPAVRRTSSGLLLGREAILRSLAIFNLIFAFETVLDAAYLWGGVALPDGMTYAAYAHRGAYPLVVTALLAAGFVLVAMRPGSAASRDGAIRRLVYLWAAQNVVLVVSSILRLDLYVDVYSLTYWRAAAFVWMALVALGLVSIIVRIVLDRSNRWLLNVNLAMLSMTLYAACFVDFAARIADFNVAHSREMRGSGIDLDVWYLASLGTSAIPAIDRVLAADPDLDLWQRKELLAVRDEEALRHGSDLEDWRSWTFRDLRFSRYLETSEPPRPVEPAPNAGPPEGQGN